MRGKLTQTELGVSPLTLDPSFLLFLQRLMEEVAEKKREKTAELEKINNDIASFNDDKKQLVEVFEDCKSKRDLTKVRSCVCLYL